MKKKTITFFIVFVLFSLILFQFITYCTNSYRNRLCNLNCSYEVNDECYRQLFEALLPNLLVNNAKIKGKDIVLINPNPSPILYSIYALQKSSMFLNINDYDNHSIMLSCLRSETLNIKEIEKIEFFLENLKEKNQNIFLLINLENMHVERIKQILKYSDNISGIVFVFNIEQQNNLIIGKQILDIISKNFILVSRTLDYGYRNGPFFVYKNPKKIYTKYFKGDIFGSVVYLSYINKSFVEQYSISLTQSSDKLYQGKRLRWQKTHMPMTYNDIHYFVTFSEYFKQKILKFFGKGT